MRHTRLLAALVLISLTACAPAGGLRIDRGGPFPPGPDLSGGEAVDGLTVGHRLMAAGEYELALKAYYRGAAEQGLTPDALSAIGSANIKLGRLGQAETILRRAVELDETSVPAWNNLGVVLMETGRTGEAAGVFRTAFALDSGRTAEIRDNLRLALEKIENPVYAGSEEIGPALVRRGRGEYLLLTAR